LKDGGDPQSAATKALDLLAAKTRSTAGLILIDRDGKIGYARNTTHMPVCSIRDPGQMRLDS
jgi:isoaspartyl peptidase/L-asparaginase-like protein (Ntn-hydrolase superfamily)